MGPHLTEAARRFSVALGNLERTQLAMTGVSAGADGWKQQLIDLRRQLQAEIGALSEIASGIAALQRDSETGTRFWEALARMRAAVALHQANWPAVAIEPSDAAYLSSVAAVRTANRDFMSVATAITGQIR